MKYLLVSFWFVLVSFAGFLITEEPTRRTLFEWAANIGLITTTANCIIALVRFCFADTEFSQTLSFPDAGLSQTLSFATAWDCVATACDCVMNACETGWNE